LIPFLGFHGSVNDASSLFGGTGQQVDQLCAFILQGFHKTMKGEFYSRKPGFRVKRERYSPGRGAANVCRLKDFYYFFEFLEHLQSPPLPAIAEPPQRQVTLFPSFRSRSVEREELLYQKIKTVLC